MKRVSIFTTNSVEKLHPRIEMEVEILKRKGFNVNIVRSTERREGFLWEIVNLVTLKYFKWRAIYRFKKKLDACDIAHIYDLQLLPLAKKAFKKNKYVIYETLDDNVHLNFFAVSEKLKFLKPFRRIVTERMAEFERRFTSSYCAKVIVNSPNLIIKFSAEKVSYIPYSSPLEGVIAEKYSNEKETVFLYLGKLTEGKGSRIYKELIDQHNKKLIFFGKAYDSFSIDFIKNEPRVKQMGNMSAEELRFALRKVFNQYNPIGLSIILPENESYKWQEANKDIDYITMRVPFIGNDRPPTLEKIKKGVGVLFNKSDEVKQLLENENDFYTTCSFRCNELVKDYTCENFEQQLLLVYK